MAWLLTWICSCSTRKRRIISRRPSPNYRYTLTAFLDYLSVRGVKGPEGVKATHIRAFLAHLQTQGYADTTVHGHARAIKAFFNFLVTEEILEASPMRKVTMPKLEAKILPPFSACGIMDVTD